MQKRFIGPVNPDPETGEADAGHDVLINGRKLGKARHGEVIEIPDELVAATDDFPGVAFSEELWEDVRPAAAAKRVKGED